MLLHILRKQSSIKINGHLKKAFPQNNCSSFALKTVYFPIMEAVARKCSEKKVFLKNSQMLHLSSFNRVAGLDRVPDYKRSCLLVILGNFWDHIFSRTSASSATSGITKQLTFSENASFLKGTRPQARL